MRKTIKLVIIDNVEHQLFQPFTLTELDKVLKKTSNTSPGTDDITYDMIANLQIRAKKLLLLLYSRLFFEGECIEDLKTVRVVLILKPGKPYNISSS